MSFERWITRLADGYYAEFGDPDDPFTYTYGKFGCLFLGRVAEAVRQPAAVARASEVRTEQFAARFSEGLKNCVWDPRHTIESRRAAVSAAPGILESMSEPAKAAGGTWLFWENIVYSRRWWIPEDEPEMTSAVETGILASMKSLNSNIRDGAEHALWMLHDQG